MKKFDIETHLVEGVPTVRIKMTIWGVAVAAWESRRMLTGIRKVMWPITIVIVFFYGLTRRTQELSLLPPGES